MKINCLIGITLMFNTYYLKYHLVSLEIEIPDQFTFQTKLNLIENYVVITDVLYMTRGVRKVFLIKYTNKIAISIKGILSPFYVFYFI